MSELERNKVDPEHEGSTGDDQPVIDGSASVDETPSSDDAGSATSKPAVSGFVMVDSDDGVGACDIDGECS